MQDLTLVGLTDDRRHLILVSDSGAKFALPVDATLRATLRGEHSQPAQAAQAARSARPGQLEIQMDSALRPRDIQARIRAGESPEHVAAAAQTTVDRIMAFANPVLAERAHIADRAQRASVRRATGEGPSRILYDAVEERLRSHGVGPEAVEWDAWRRDDGRWTLVADYRSEDSARHAKFVYDAAGRYVLAEDDEARWLVGDAAASEGVEPRAGSERRLSSVGPDDEQALPLGEDAIGLVREPDPETDPNTDPETDPNTEPETDRATDGIELDDQADDPGEAGPATDLPRRASKKARGRASVPSWDEIMFGGGNRE